MRKSVRKERIAEIEQVALSLFAEKGFAETSLDEIAQKVGLTKPSLYLYFKNKNDLFFKMIQSRFLYILDNMKTLVAEKEDFSTKIRIFILYYISHFFENRAFFRLIHKLRGEFIKHSNPKQKLAPKYKDFINLISEIMAQGMQEKILKNDDPLFLSVSLIGILNQNLLLTFGLKNSSKKSSTEDKIIKEDKMKIINKLTDKILNLFLNGVGRTK